jgi:hypothetical protein
MNTTLQNVVERMMPFLGGQALFFLSYPDNQIFRVRGALTCPTVYDGEGGQSIFGGVL